MCPNQEEEETDELLLLDEEMLDAPPEDLPRRLLTNFAVYNAEVGARDTDYNEHFLTIPNGITCRMQNSPCVWLFMRLCEFPAGFTGAMRYLRGLQAD